MVGGTAVSGGPTKVAWLSVDPRGGTVTLYPHEVTNHIESEFLNCRRSAALAGLGGPFENATIEFGLTGGDHTQRTSHGRRDVRRVETLADATEISVNVVRERGWKIVEFAVPGITEERRLDITALPVRRPGASGPPEASSSTAQDPAARSRSLADSDAKGLVGLWEWCKNPEPKDPKVVPAKDWGVYNLEQNADVESAFRAGLASVTLTLGIRTYDVMFDNEHTGRQVDRALRKRRWVQRRAVNPAERDKALAEGNATSALRPGDEEDCPICFSSFAESASMPTVRPSCGHIFHCACAQQLADRNDPCPMCRAEVDWRAAFGKGPR